MAALPFRFDVDVGGESGVGLVCRLDPQTSFHALRCFVPLYFYYIFRVDT